MIAGDCIRCAVALVFAGAILFAADAGADSEKISAQALVAALAQDLPDDDRGYLALEAYVALSNLGKGRPALLDLGFAGTAAERLQRLQRLEQEAIRSEWPQRARHAVTGLWGYGLRLHASDDAEHAALVQGYVTSALASDASLYALKRMDSSGKPIKRTWFSAANREALTARVQKDDGRGWLEVAAIAGCIDLRMWLTERIVAFNQQEALPTDLRPNTWRYHMAMARMDEEIGRESLAAFLQVYQVCSLLDRCRYGAQQLAFTRHPDVMPLMLAGLEDTTPVAYDEHDQERTQEAGYWYWVALRSVVSDLPQDLPDYRTRPKESMAAFRAWAKQRQKAIRFIR